MIVGKPHPVPVPLPSLSSAPALNPPIPMKTRFLSLLIVLSGLVAQALAQPAEAPSALQSAAPPSAAMASSDTPPAATDSRQLSTALQNLPWPRFRAVIEAVPKLASGVDAYGPLGWQFVKENYRTYNWKKKIDKLDPAQKQQLAELIQQAQTAP